MKKILFAFTAMLLAGAAQAGILYWTVGSTSGYTGDYSYARLMATTSTGTPNYESLSTDTKVNGWYTKGSATSAKSDVTALTASELGGTSSDTYYIYIELMDDAYNAVAVSTAVAISTLSANIGTEAQAATAWQAGGTFSAVPEPTSALLMLLGLAGLALKRPASRKRYAVTGKRV